MASRSLKERRYKIIFMGDNEARKKEMYERLCREAAQNRPGTEIEKDCLTFTCSCNENVKCKVTYQLYRLLRDHSYFQLGLFISLLLF